MQSGTTLKQFPTRSGPCRTWSDVVMQKTISITANEQGISLHQAAKMYEIPRSTLHDHVTPLGLHHLLVDSFVVDLDIRTPLFS